MKRSIAIFAVAFAFGSQGSIWGEAPGQAGQGGALPGKGRGSGGSTGPAVNPDRARCPLT
jgi:hypothetical protein